MYYGCTLSRGSMKRTSASLVLVMLLFPSVVSAQAPAASRDTTTHEYRGAYQSGFEKSWFSPCATPADDKLWWVTLTDDALHQRDSLFATLKSTPTDGYTVRWRASISPRMPAGHMARGTRYMLVTQIFDVKRLPSDWNCMTI